MMKWKLMIVSNFIYAFTQGIFLPFFVYILISRLGLESVGMFYSLFNMFIGFSIGVSFYINKKISERNIIFLATLLLSLINFYSFFVLNTLILLATIVFLGFLYGIQISPSSELAIKISERCLYFSLLAYYFGMGLGGIIFYKYFEVLISFIALNAFLIASLTLFSAGLFYYATKGF